MRISPGVVRWLATLAVVLGMAIPAVADNAVGDTGLLVSVPSPLTSEDVTRIKKRIDEARAKGEQRPAKVVFDFTPADKPVGGSEFGPSFDLARFIDDLKDVQTIGFLRQKVTGHVVLPLLACQEIVMGNDAELGEVVGKDEKPLDERLARNYQTILSTNRPAQMALIRKMYDPGVEVVKGTKKEGGVWYIDLREVAAAEKAGIVVADRVPLPLPKVGIYNTRAALEFGLSKAQENSREGVAVRYGIAPATLRDDPISDRTPNAYRLTLTGKVDQGMRETVVRTLREVVRQKGNLLFLHVECAGGDMTAARGLADDILSATRGGADAVKVIAYIPEQAPDTAAVIALGCSEIVMSLRKDKTTPGGDPVPESTFGDFENFLKGKNIPAELKNVRELAEKQGYPVLLIDGMFLRDLELFSVHDKIDRSKRAILTRQEFEANKDKWVLEMQLKGRGQLLKLNATQAYQNGIARMLVDKEDPSDLYQRYGVEGKVKEATPAWLDQFAAFLRIHSVTIILVIVGFTGLLLELKVPGTAIPGIISALCFIMVFWAHTQFSGQLVVLAGLLFLLGLVLILMEVFVFPGFGAAGVFGILLMLASLGLVTVEQVPQTGDQWIRFASKMAQYLFGLIAAVLVAFFVARFLPRMPFGRQLALAAPDDTEGEAGANLLPGAAQAASLLGAIGDATTVLRPAGTVKFGDQYVDVVSEGGYIPPGTRVQVIEVEGTRIVVKEV